jgi:tetrahydromethanopterin S-methyltransferase subunit G
MNLFKQFSLKERNFGEKLTRPATEAERIGERNNRFLGRILLGAIVGLVLLGLYTVGKYAVSLF